MVFIRNLILGLVAMFSLLSVSSCVYQTQSSKMNIALSIEEDDWESLVQAVTTFSKKENFAFRNFSEEYDSGRKKLALELIRRDGVEINIIGSSTQDGLLIAVYENEKGANWLPVAESLVSRLQAQWPNKVVVDRKG